MSPTTVGVICKKMWIYIYIYSIILERPSHYVLHVVSMDVVVDAVWGDAMAVGTRDYWQKAALDGFVVAFLAGPPCETWSKARGKGIPLDQRRKPLRILRTAEHLWGLPSLALKELAQVLIGNQLLTFTLLMAATMVQTGGCGVLEHPAESEDDMAASIWKVPAVLALLRAPGVCRHRLAQGLFGAPSAKATDLMTINLPDIVQDLRHWMIRRELPHGSSIGLTADGQWRTGIFKEYPPAMCGALASSFRREIDQILTKAGVEPTDADVARWESLTVTTYSSHLGADYACWRTLVNSRTPALAAAQSSNGPGGEKKVLYYIYSIYITPNVWQFASLKSMLL